MGILQEIGGGMLAIILLIIGFVILLFSALFYGFGFWYIAFPLMILGLAILIVSKKRI